MRTKKVICILCAILVTVSFFGCKKDASDIAHVSVSEVTHSVFYAPQYAAIELGYFEDEGIEIELINGGGADNVMTAVLSGQVDIGFAGPEAAIYVINEGMEDSPKVFCRLTQKDGSFIISREKENNFDYSEFSGKHIIGGRKGGVPLMTLMYVLKDHGVYEGDVNMDTSVDFNNMVSAFTSGVGDYVTAFEPTASMLEREGIGHIVASVGKDSGEIPYTAYFAKQSYIKENRDVVLGFTRAIYRAQQWIKATDNAEIARVISPYFADTDISLLESSVTRYKQIEAWSDNPLLEEESLNRLMDVMDYSGELKARPAYEDTVDTSIAQEVMK